jgi:hypothetical protein
MLGRFFIRLSLLITVGFLLTSPPAFARGELPARAPVSARAAEPQRKIVGYTTPRAMSPADAERYAARAANNPKARQFRGGDAVVIISASALAVILAVVLLIVLL